MNAIVVYESVYGNTHAVAGAIAEGLGGVPVLPVHEVAGRLEPVDLLVVGGPTHMHGIATSRSRRVAADGVHAEQEIRLDPDAKSEPGLREWLVDLTPGAAHAVAAFDTRLDRTPWLTGAASHGIARRMRRHGLDVVATESFLVDDAEGPLAAGELKRARAWGAELLSAFSPRADTMAGASA